MREGHVIYYICERMSILVTTREEVVRSPLNRSTAKPLFSFSHARRFCQPSVKLKYKMAFPLRCDRFYELPSMKSRRATSFGYGSRIESRRPGHSPPPGTYNLPSDFEPGQRSSRAHVFGQRRGSSFTHYSTPGPGSYEIAEPAGKSAQKVSFHARCRTAGI
jgi:hypothetical protein